MFALPEILVLGWALACALASYLCLKFLFARNKKLRSRSHSAALSSGVIVGAFVLCGVVGWHFASKELLPEEAYVETSSVIYGQTSEAGEEELERAIEQAERAQEQIEQSASAATQQAATAPPAETREASAAVEEPTHAVVRVFFATDRNFNGEADPSAMFGVGRASLTYGTCDVSIPRDHRMGELESPSILKLQFSEDPARHIVLLHTAIWSKDDFFAEMAKKVRQFSRSSAFLFIHGYNVTFEDASRRTAQISYDLGFEGAPVFYSWPSQGAKTAYTVDEQNIEWTQANLAAFLEDFFMRSEAENIFLIAHSMGNRALTRAVASLLKDHPEFRPRLSEVILTAPDIDAEVFKRDIAPALVATGRPITLYSSSEDLALVASKKVHGYPRAGDSGAGLLLVQGIETIDATNVDTNLLGHSYFAEAQSVLADIFYLVRSNQRPDQRFGLRGVDVEGGRYWEFKP
jgi:esterase/lipase superfamily enzyme